MIEIEFIASLSYFPNTFYKSWQPKMTFDLYWLEVIDLWLDSQLKHLTLTSTVRSYVTWRLTLTWLQLTVDFDLQVKTCHLTSHPKLVTHDISANNPEFLKGCFVSIEKTNLQIFLYSLALPQQALFRGVISPWAPEFEVWNKVKFLRHLRANNSTEQDLLEQGYVQLSIIKIFISGYVADGMTCADDRLLQ